LHAAPHRHFPQSLLRYRPEWTPEQGARVAQHCPLGSEPACRFAFHAQLVSSSSALRHKKGAPLGALQRALEWAVRGRSTGRSRTLCLGRSRSLFGAVRAAQVIPLWRFELPSSPPLATRVARQRSRAPSHGGADERRERSLFAQRCGSCIRRSKSMRDSARPRWPLHPPSVRLAFA
jgi:hypothetical protein